MAPAVRGRNIREVKMKKWISFLIASFLCLFALPRMTAFAAAEGTLSVRNQDVSVTLSIPEGKTQAITALHVRLLVSADSGEIEKPSFRFAGTIPSSIKDVEITNKGGQYVVDLVLAGKKGQDIFVGSAQATIGTLSLYAGSSSSSASVKFAAEPGEGSKKPSVSYTGSEEYGVRYAVLTDAQPVTVRLSGSVRPSIPGTNPPGTNPPGTDPPGTGTPGTDLPGTDPSKPETESFDKAAVPKLTLSVKTGQRRITYKWKKAAGSDGYQIYQYDTKTKKYKRLKTIFDGKTVSYSRNMEYATDYTFKLRAFQTNADGSRTYGKFSKGMKVTTAPAKVTSLKLGKQKAKKTQKTIRITAAWKKVARADGYQIFRSTKKNGTYTRIKTLTNAKTVKYSGISQKRGRKYYYKVRAFAVGADGKRKYGNYSSVKYVKS